MTKMSKIDGWNDCGESLRKERGGENRSRSVEAAGSQGTTIIKDTPLTTGSRKERRYCTDQNQ
jgi:hypothetical protein